MRVEIKSVRYHDDSETILYIHPELKNTILMSDFWTKITYKAQSP